MPPLTDHQTVTRAKNAFKSGGATGLRDLLKLIETLSSNLGHVSLTELSTVIEKDTAVLSRLLTVANTLGHNPTLAPIGTIDQAIHQVGFFRLRSLAVSLMLLDKTGGARNPPEQQEASTHALCSGLMAQGCAAQLGTLDPDLAFACATLRNLGAVLLPAVSLEHLRALTTAAKGKPRDADYKKTFGLTPLELSRELLSGIRLPEEIKDAFRELHPTSTRGAAATRFDTRLLAIAEFGSRIARQALDPKLSPEGFHSASRTTAKEFAHLLPGEHALIEPALTHTTDCLENFLRSSGIASLPAQSLRRLKLHAHFLRGDTPASAAAHISTPQPTATTEHAHPGAPNPDPASKTLAYDETSDSASTPATDADIPDELTAHDPSATPPTEDPETAWDAALAHSDAITSQPMAAAVDLIGTALVSARDTLSADETWLFRPPAGGATFELVATRGRECAAFQNDASVRYGERSVFGLCLARREVVALHDADDPKIVPYLPPWWRTLENPPRAVALVPVTPAGAAMPRAMTLIGWRAPRHIALTAEQVSTLHQLFIHAIGADAKPHHPGSSG